MDIKIIARNKQGIRRCGVFHPGDKAVVHPAGTFTPEQIETLEKDPDLIVGEAADEGAVGGTVSRQDFDDVLAANEGLRSQLRTANGQVSSLSSDLSSERSQHDVTRGQLTTALARAEAAEKKLEEKKLEEKKPADKKPGDK